MLRDGNNSLAFALLSPDDRRVLTVSANNYSHESRGVFTFIGPIFARSGALPTARLWDAATGRMIAQWEPDLGPNGKLDRYGQSSPYNAAFSPDGRLVATTFGLYPDCSAEVHDAATGKKMVTLKGHQQPVVWVAFSPDSRQVATASLDETACLWEADTGKRLQSFKGHTGALVSVVFSPDGRRLLAWGDWMYYRFSPTGQAAGSRSRPARTRPRGFGTP